MKAFLDTESTGNRQNELAQLSYIITDDDLNILKARNFFFAVSSMNPFATKLHGLTIDKLARLSGGKTFKDYAEEIYTDLTSAQLICHNYRGDFEILQREFSALDMTYNPPGVFCSMDHFRSVCMIADQNGASKNPALKELVSFFAIDSDEVSAITESSFGVAGLPAHDGRYDAAALYAVCRTALERDDYMRDARLPQDNSLPKPRLSPAAAPVVSLAEHRRRKLKLRREQMKRIARYQGKAPLSRYVWPILAGLVLVSLLLR